MTETAPFVRRVWREPLLLVAAAWPLVLLTPHIPGIPRPSIHGLPWRQELTGAALLLLPLFLSLKRGGLPENNRRGFHHIILLPLCAGALFTAWVWLSAAWAVQPYAAFHLGFQWAIALLFYSQMTGVAASVRLSRISFTTLATVIWILAISCALETWLGAPLTDASFRYDAKPLLRGSGGFGEIMAVATCLFAAQTLHARRAIMCGATALAAWQATLQSLERAPFLGACVGLLVIFSLALLRKNCRPRSLMRLALLAAALLGVTLLQSVRLAGSGGEVTHYTPTTVSRLRSGFSNDSNTHARLLFWGVGLEMWRARPMRGVGAGNYEVFFPEARARLSARHPDSPLIAINEQFLTVYAHNEYIQILAELGIVGLSLFALFGLFLAAAFYRALRAWRRALPAAGAFAGVLAFAISSGASASSFRYFGGALIFFFAASLLTPRRPVVSITDFGVIERKATLYRVAMRLRLIAAMSLSLLILSSAGLGTQAAGTILFGMAQQNADAIRAERLYLLSLKVSPWSPATHFGYGNWLYARGREAESVSHLRFAVARGFNGSVCYALLAASEAAAGDVASSERTLAEAVRVYPRSVFLRVRHAAALDHAGRTEEAQVEMAAAHLLDSRAARGWQQLIAEDIDAAAISAKQDPGIATPGELQPAEAVFIVLGENERRFPQAARKGWRARMRSVQF